MILKSLFKLAGILRSFDILHNFRMCGHKFRDAGRLPQSQSCRIWEFLAKCCVNCMFLTQGVFITEQVHILYIDF